MDAPKIVALVSESRRGTLVQLLAQRNPTHQGAVVFAADGADAARSVTGDSFLVVDGSRLPELGHFSRGVVAEQAPYHVDFGLEVEAWLTRLPQRTQHALGSALANPRACSVKRLAHTAGISTRQLVRQCHAAGCPVHPKDLLTAARLVAAQALLRGPRRPTVRELAHACGWVDSRSLRAAIRRAALPSVAALAHLAQCRANVSDLIARIQRTRA